jgi:pimeloyl-ACP methyl ester carboxylesterase
MRAGLLTLLSLATAPQACVAPNAAAQERIPGVESHYGEVTTSDGATLRIIITRPENAVGPLKPLLFAQWVSCGTLDYAPTSTSRKPFGDYAQKSGLAFVRVERSAARGGPACEQLDYDTEVAHYVDAFAEILKDPLVDPGKIYILGSSLGSTTAPLIAAALQEKGFDIAGIAVQGGGAVTYLERMLNFDRIYLERRPDKVKPAEIHGEFISRARFHYEYLVNDRDPDEIAKDSQAMAKVRSDVLGLGQGEHYGRPYAWHQQAAKRNFLAAWAEIDAPVLVIFNEFDQYETRHGHQLIVDTVNRLRPGTGTFVEQKGVDHNDTRFATIEAAYADQGGTPVPESTAGVVLDWLKKIGAGT